MSTKRAVVASSLVWISNNGFGTASNNDEQDKKKKVFPTTTLLTTSSSSSSSSSYIFSPTLPIRIFRPNANLEIAYDTRTRTPLYVLEKLQGIPNDTNNNKNKMKKKRYQFQEESSLPMEFRSRQNHYRGSGYDRGHLAAAANYNHDLVTLKDTFTLINTIPQNPSVNKREWAQLEAWVRKVAKTEWQEQLYTTVVITGPLWLPSARGNNDDSNPNVFYYSYKGLGTPPTLMAVPTHVYKVVLVVDTENERIAKFAAFCMPNDDSIVNNNNNNNMPGPVDLAHYLVRLSDLEAVTGMYFVSSRKLCHHADHLTEAVWNQTQQQQQQHQSLLLLTQGDNHISKGRKKAAAISGKEMAELLVHLCSSGACR